jgi:hypothetical protein
MKILIFDDQQGVQIIVEMYKDIVTMKEYLSFYTLYPKNRYFSFDKEDLQSG